MIRFSLIIAAITAMLVTAISGFFIIPWLKRLKYGQTIKEVGPTWHQGKQGTPMMGGLMFILGSLVGLTFGYTSIMQDAQQIVGAAYVQSNVTVIVSIITALAFGFVGFVDDYIKVVKKQNMGLSAIWKIIMQSFITASYLYSLHINGVLSTSVSLPFINSFDFGIAFYPISFLLIIFIVNAVNLTDGIDGLASIITFVVCLGFMVLACLLNYYTLGLLSAAVAGGCAGFLAWNFYPAKVFMGDTGSMFLGGVVAVLAYGIGHPELLFLMGFVYMCEAGSVVLQVSYFKLTHGKRIFKMSPIHHHFEMCGWNEIKIDVVFGFTAVVTVFLGCMYIYTSC